jgi:hypothetical protein
VAGGGVVLRGDEAEAAQERRVEAARPGAAAVGVGVHPRVDEGERDAAPRRFGDEARPEVLFGPDREVGAPVVEEAAARPGQVEGQELVDRAGGQVAAVACAEERAVEVMRNVRSGARSAISATSPRRARTSPSPTA